MRRENLAAILSQMHRRFGRWQFQRADWVLSQPLSRNRLRKWTESPSLRRWRLPGAGTVAEVQTIDGAKIIFEDKSWLLLRPSGTEPLLRIYAEARDWKTLSALLRLGRSIGRQIVH